MKTCPVCQATLQPVALHCPGCDLTLNERFGLPPLARLNLEDTHLAEQFLLAGGNLKSLAEQLDTSYPTLRKRLDGLIERLRQLQRETDAEIEQILKQIESGELKPEKAIRLIKELRGES